MKSSLVCVLLLFLVYAFPTLSNACNMENKDIFDKNVAVNDSLLRHVVMFNWVDNISDDQLSQIEQAFIRLPSKIKEIIDFEWGTNNSPEGLDKGFTHCFFVTFADEKGRDIYLPHPDHKAFVALLDGLVEDVIVLDYWTR